MKDEPYIIKAIQASIEAGEAILEVYNSDFAVEYKADKSPLTLADKRSHEIIVRYLKEFNIPILSEEGKEISYEERKMWNTLWIVDPLDGTKEFVKRNGEFTVNIALVRDGKTELGVVLVPEKGTLYFSAKGVGTYKLDNALWMDRAGPHSKNICESLSLDQLIDQSKQLLSDHSRLVAYTIAGSRSHPSKELEAFVEEKRKQYSDVEFISAGSSLKFCLLAEGKAHIYPRLGPTMEWDTAAGHAVAENAGAKVYRYDDGRPLTYNKENLLNPWFVVSPKGHDANHDGGVK